MDRAAVFLVALAASAILVAAAAWSLRGVRAISFEAPPAPSPPEARGIAVMPLDWPGEQEETGTFAAGPSPPEPPGAFFRPRTAPARPGVADSAWSAAKAFRAGRAAFPPADGLAAGVAVETRRASAAILPVVAPAERPETPGLRVSPSGRVPAPPPPGVRPGRLELPPPLAEELLR